jgi:galactokinase
MIRESNSAAVVAHKFRAIYGEQPRVFRAPGRVNIIGEHTDYNQGFVLPVAISRFTYAAIRPRGDRRLRVASLNYPDKAETTLDQLRPRRHWSDYVFGIAAMLTSSGYEISGADLLVSTDIPIGAGLSSSAAVEVSTALAFASLMPRRPDAAELALVAQKAESEFVGMKCGIMDQFIGTFGKRGNALRLDCRSLEWQLVPLPPGYAIVVCNTGVKHELAASEYNQRRAECEEGVKLLQRCQPEIRSVRDITAETLDMHVADLPEPVLRRCRHVVSENARVLEAQAALTRGDMGRVRSLLAQSHASLRDQYEVSCPELDSMVEIAAEAPGFASGRMTGGGFGGCTVNFVEAAAAEEFRPFVLERYAARWPQRHGEAYVVESADGGCELVA